MILSVSRRTDIPAFYMEWFLNRLKEGYVLVRNPMNYHQVSRITISPSTIDCIVFWTKDPSAILKELDQLSKYHFYFQVTLNGYGEGIEKYVPPHQKVIQSFQRLSRKIGVERSIWRYDPIILTDRLDLSYHSKQFELLAQRLEGYTSRCVISFMDKYKKTERNMKGYAGKVIEESGMLEIASLLNDVARKYHICISTCSEAIELKNMGIEHARCIDSELIEKIVGYPLNLPKDKNQREACKCAESIDIGAYNTCGFGCRYCYANYSDDRVQGNMSRHDPRSPILIGSIEPEDKIIERKVKLLSGR